MINTTIVDDYDGNIISGAYYTLEVSYTVEYRKNFPLPILYHFQSYGNLTAFIATDLKASVPYETVEPRFDTLYIRHIK